MELIKRLIKDEEGQGLVEYALIIGLIAVLCMGALTLLKDDIVSVFGKITASL
jgi:pilus assembly protein Flp/PilA